MLKQFTQLSFIKLQKLHNPIVERVFMYRSSERWYDLPNKYL
jgi:hypothetical protein